MKQVCVYYDQKTKQIIDFLPNMVDTEFKGKIRELWSQEIPRKILKLLSTEQKITAPKIKEKIGHSMSTLHENIKKLEDSGLIETKMIYVGNKQKIIEPKAIFVTKNPKFKSIIQNFLNRGFWIDSNKLNKIIDYLQKNPDKPHTAEELSTKLKIPVDEIHSLLSSWDSQVTRAFST
ncbi:MAG: helix-turn-helix domain-containing protein, partial [Candidatus Woesearchaeota archaeon]